MNAVINEMLINGIEFQDGSAGEMWVDAEILEHFLPEKYSKSLNENEFYMLALEYLDLFGKDIESTEYAKIDYWTKF